MHLTYFPLGDYVNKCVPIYNLAIKGDWKEARTMLLADRRLATAAISQGWATLLHVAAEANHLHFVEELLKQLNPNDLEIQDFKGNTAFCFAAAVGNVKIAEAMVQMNRSLPTIRGGEGLTPLHMAALQGKSEMAWYLYPHTLHEFGPGDWDLLFFLCINTGIYGMYICIFCSSGPLPLFNFLKPVIYNLQNSWKFCRLSFTDVT